MIYYPETESHIRDKVKVVLNMPSYATKKELEHAACIDTSDLAAEKNFIALKAKINRLDIIKLVKVSISLNILKTKLDDLALDK